MATESSERIYLRVFTSLRKKTLQMNVFIALLLGLFLLILFSSVPIVQSPVSGKWCHIQIGQSLTKLSVICHKATPKRLKTIM